MALTHAEIVAVTGSLSETIAGGWIQKIHQSGDALFAFDIRVPGQSLWLIISCEHGLSRIHLAHEKPASPPSLPRFCAALRKHLNGGILESIRCADNDRIVTLCVKRGDEKGKLICELFPRTGNLFLLDESDLVIDAAKRSDVGRALKSGMVYERPETPGHIPLKPLRNFGHGDIAEAVGDYYEKLIVQKRRDDLAQRLSGVLRRQNKKTRNYLQKLEDELRGIGDPQALQRLADNFAAAMHEHRRGMSRLAVPDLYGDGEIEIPLDPAQSASRNLEKLYSKAGRNRRKLKALGLRIGEMQSHVELLDRLEKDLSQAGDVDELRDLEQTMIAEKLLRKKTPAKKSRGGDEGGPKHYTSKDGFEILVGRNARENDTLTFKVARGNDWWFHTVGYPSSHVIVHAPKDRSISQEAILDAATLTILKSKLARQGGGEVMYAQRKYVRKPKGAPPGKVQVENEKVIFLRLDDLRVKRLKEQG